MRRHKYDRNHAKKLIRLYGNTCFLCGTIVVRHKTIKKHRKVIKFSHDKITWVSGDGLIHERSVATIDHVIPVSKGGVNHIRNKTILCGTCNNKKSNLTPIKKPKQFYCKCGREKLERLLYSITHAVTGCGTNNCPVEKGLKAIEELENSLRH